ncbi:hypothetical protein CDAR_396151 [Caerostris darwini]|uniref:Uncharacterized protein n=1 Tax=Caerostris darwini TaxID=1538125 RepID=A0AAV4WNK3_9ARAC|nr:hypothetical protein CDAR_396151 [Caerostris darwini]
MLSSFIPIGRQKLSGQWMCKKSWAGKLLFIFSSFTTPPIPPWWQEVSQEDYVVEEDPQGQKGRQILVEFLTKPRQHGGKNGTSKMSD